jgi:glycosyltransferase involved in cell wall biosynthesis
VVASGTGGLHEIIRSDLDGMLAEPDDPKALADAVSRCIAAADSMRENARRRFVSRFELRVRVRAFLEPLEA